MLTWEAGDLSLSLTALPKPEHTGIWVGVRLSNPSLRRELAAGARHISARFYSYLGSGLNRSFILLFFILDGALKIYFMDDVST
jgi:hypothetical protein